MTAASAAAFGVLGPEACQRIHRLSAAVLERVGVAVDDAGLRQRLAGRGARVCGERVHLPEALLRELLSTAPANLRLGSGRGAEQRIGLRGGVSLWPGNALYLVDGKERRPLDAADFARLTRLVDRLPHVDAMVGIAVSQFPPPARDLRTLRLMAQHTGKHLRPVITSRDSIDGVVEMTRVLLAGRAADAAAPVSFGYSIVSPLRWTATALALFARTSGLRLPLMLNAEPLAGGTSPVTLAGSLAQANAETLSGIAIAQLLEPGRPCVYNAGFGHTLDMRSAVALCGAPEVYLLAAASAAMARHYGLPCASWVSTEAMVEDGQAAAEKTAGLQLHVERGVNLIWGMGQLESQLSVSAAQLVIDDELAAGVLRLQRGFEVDDDRLAADVLLTATDDRRDLLGHPHTLRWFRDELSQVHLGNRQVRERWQARGAPDLRARARQTVEELLAPPWEPRLADDAQRELERIEREWVARLEG